MPTPANSINEATTGITGFTGTAFTGTPVTQYNVLTGGATSSTLNNVAPSATSGVPLISQGSSSHPTFGTSVVSGGGTGNTSFTAYSIIAAGTTSTGAFQNVSGVGTSGQVLTSNGASALPTWQTAAGGGSFTLISTQTASSSASVSFTGLSSSYGAYMVVYYNVAPATDIVTLYLRTSSDGGSTYDSAASDYSYAFQTISQAASPASSLSGAAASSFIGICNSLGNAANEIDSGWIVLPNPTGATYTQVEFMGFGTNSSSLGLSTYGAGVRLSTSGVNAIQLLFSSGNIATGTFKLYGLSAS